MKDILVVGTGGLAREFSSYFSGESGNIRILGFASTNHAEHSEFKLPGVLFKDEITPDLVGTKDVVIAIGNPLVKKSYYERLKFKGFSFPTIVHPSSTISSRAVLQDGVVISPNCVISPDVRIETLSYLNFCCGVGHDVVVGSFVQVNPGAQLGGGVRVGDCSLIGSGAVVLQDVKVGEAATVGSGAVVFARVRDGATVMGNPAKHIRAFE